MTQLKEHELNELRNQRNILKKEKDSIEAWLKGHRWQAMKFLLGEWAEDDPRYVEYLSMRLSKRTRHEEINTLLIPLNQTIYEQESIERSRVVHV